MVAEPDSRFAIHGTYAVHALVGNGSQRWSMGSTLASTRRGVWIAIAERAATRKFAAVSASVTRCITSSEQALRKFTQLTT